MTWAAPATGGTPTGYDVRINGGSPTDVGLVLAHTFSGLSHGTAYTVEVRAYNAEGDSSWVLLNVTTDTALPGVPTSVAADPGLISILLTWAAPASGDPPTGYEVRIDGGSPIDVGADLFHSFTGLSPSTTYTLEVRAYNLGGESSWVSIDSTTDSLPPGGNVVCGCPYDWRIEILNLSTGERRGYLTPLSFEFEEKLNEVGSGTITIPVSSVSMQDVWPHITSIAFLRIAGPGATSSSPVCEFIGMVEQVDPDSGGTLKIGVKSIEQYLDSRMIDETLVFTAEEQTSIGASLVDEAATLGIPLSGGFTASSFPRDRTYELVDRKKILEAIQQLTQVIDGPDYQLVHSLSGTSSWQTEMLFQDRVGSDVPRPLNARRGLIAYGLPVDATAHVTKVIGVGENDTLVYETSTPTSDMYPLFERSEAYSDVSVLTTVQEHAEGSLAQDKHPIATPTVTVAGLDLIAPLSLGDLTELKMGHGAIQYQGVARIIGIAWSSTESTPTMATLTLVPNDNAADAILGAPPSSSGCC
jgi:hypothetical protein